MRKAQPKPASVTLRLSSEEIAELDKVSKAYGDRPTRCETAQRLLDMELMRGRRGA